MECEYYNRRCVRNTNTFTVDHTSNTNSNSNSAGHTDSDTYAGNSEPDRDAWNTDTFTDDLTVRYGHYVLKPSGDHNQ